jgi:integral membrane sensor domain MASE1
VKALVKISQATWLAIAYFAAAWSGLQFTSDVSSTITFFWAPSGLAVAFALLWGRSMLAGAWVAAFAVNLLVGEATPVAAFVIATGNTASYFAACVIVRWLGYEGLAPMQIARLLPAALAAPCVAATVGTWALFATGALRANEWLAAWGAWWVGDAVGMAVLVPAILLFMGEAER